MENKTIEGFRLSPQQRDVWLQQGGDDPLVYRVQSTIQISGALNPDTLQAALDKVTQRHEIFRTTFQKLPGMTIPVQVVAEQSKLVINHHDFTDLEPSSQKTKIDALIEEARRQPFDFTIGPLAHVALVTLSPTTSSLIITLPAVCADSAGMRILAREISAAYDACVEGNEPDGEVMQYADLAEWQNELFEGEDAKKGVEFWRKQDFLNAMTLDFSFENRINDKDKLDPNVSAAIVGADIAGKIEQFCQQQEVLADAFFLACWQVLLRRLTGQGDFILGVSCTGRGYEELEDAPGLFARNLPFWSRLNEESTFAEVVKTAKISLDEIAEQQDYFSWDLFGDSEIGDVSKGYFPTGFGFVHGSDEFQASGLSFSTHHKYCYIYRSELSLICTQSHGGFNIEFHYDSVRFPRQDIERLKEQFLCLVNSVAREPETPIGEVEILSDAERERMLVEFNQTQTDITSIGRIHELFEEQAQKYPERIAVVADSDRLSYAELNARANRLAHYLRKNGVGPEIRVALCVRRSMDMLVGILGILKSGGAYVPLDPTYPTERLAFMLEDTQAPILLTQQELVEQLPEHNARVICLGSDWKTMSDESDANLMEGAENESLAYIIYTSGSTGKPKGVEVTHKNLIHSTSARFAYYKKPPESYLLLSSFAFDSSIAGIFWTLSQGGTLVLPEDGLERDVTRISELIAAHRITHMLGLPSLYSLLLATGEPAQLVSLNTVIVAGEECPMTLIETHFQLLPKSSLFNEYGPTEGTVWSSVYECQPGKIHRQVPIGRPISNALIYLTDPKMRLVPIGVAGELHVGGAGVARGYLNRADLTAERFVADTFSKDGQSRLYKTGDLARYLPDGNIEFLGRIDHQVKIRGYRIELEEIEAVLRLHTAVQEAVLAAREDTSGDKRLVAYVVCNQQPTPTVGELRSALLEKLPDYMVPAAFVFLDALPLMPNGKIDRRALPEPDQSRPTLDSAFEPPRTPVEKVVAEIWADSLEIERISVHDNFFELGGHSILATRIVSQIREALRVDIPLRTIFEAPTVAGLSQALLDVPGKRDGIEKTAEILNKLDQLSEDEVEQMLAEKTPRTRHAEE